MDVSVEFCEKEMGTGGGTKKIKARQQHTRGQMILWVRE